jgi:hypothetical protein
MYSFFLNFYYLLKICNYVRINKHAQIRVSSECSVVIIQSIGQTQDHTWSPTSPTTG